MNKTSHSENIRAERIAFRINEQHELLANIYENLVDREFILVQEDVQNLILDLRTILKLIKEDDF
jgi:hypothetical protein